LVARYATPSREVTDSDVENFHSFLESHPTDQQLSFFRKTAKYREIVKHLKKEGATEEEIESMMQPAHADPNMVWCSARARCIEMLIELQNGGYVNPPREKRMYRDPYGDWWDKQDRRNYGEPVHEDNDVLGVFSLDEYRHTPVGKASLMVGAWVLCVLSLAGVVYMTYPDKPSVPRRFPGGLAEELGGEGAVAVRYIWTPNRKSN
jgi:NADH dehydrogenase (ubiquinone) 1 beta subcomplex subunit 8